MAATDAIYLTDAYARRFAARVVRSLPGRVALDRTAFYPAGGGQPDDRGTILTDGALSEVAAVGKEGEVVWHTLGEERSLPVGTSVEGEVAWARRYAHMRYHTLLHILSGVVYRRFGAGITGGQISAERARMDFALPDFDRAVAEELVAEVRSVVERDLPVRVRFEARARLAEDPSLVRVARELVPEVDPVRLIDIVGHDVQADGGTHVRSTGEVGPVALDGLENKGARNKRLYLRLASPPVER